MSDVKKAPSATGTTTLCARLEAAIHAIEVAGTKSADVAKYVEPFIPEIRKAIDALTAPAVAQEPVAEVREGAGNSRYLVFLCPAEQVQPGTKLYAAPQTPPMEAEPSELAPRHVCGLQGFRPYPPWNDPPCPGCVAKRPNRNAQRLEVK